MRLGPQEAAEGSPKLEYPYPGLDLLLRKSRLATLYDISVGRLCVTDERPKAKEKCPSPEGTVIRPDGKVLGGSLPRTPKPEQQPQPQAPNLNPYPSPNPKPNLNPNPYPSPNPNPNPNPGPRQAYLGRLGCHW